MPSETDADGDDVVPIAGIKKTPCQHPLSLCMMQCFCTPLKDWCIHTRMGSVGLMAVRQVGCSFSIKSQVRGVVIRYSAFWWSPNEFTDDEKLCFANFCVVYI